MGNPEEAENAPGTVPLAGQENPEFSNIEQPPPAYGSYEASPQPGVSYGQPPITTQSNFTRNQRIRKQLLQNFYLELQI